MALSFWFYPIAVFIIANRILTLSLLAHEALHGNLHTNQAINDWIGNYLCALPTFVSFSRYRRLHFLHHRAVGRHHWDPDKHLYDFYPLRFSKFLFSTLYRLVTLRVMFDFLNYYTDTIDYLRDARVKGKPSFSLTNWSGFFVFVLFHITFFLILVYCNFTIYYFAFYILPLLFITQPYVLLMGGLQHGPLDRKNSRTIVGPKWLMEIVLPCDINFHEEHHINPTIPYYWLRKFHRNRVNKDSNTWSTSYTKAFSELFYPTSVNDK